MAEGRGQTPLQRRFWWLLFLVGVGLVWFLWPAKKWPATYAKPREVTSVVVATGKLRAQRQSVLSAELSALVKKLLVDEGDLVKKGQTLVLLDQSDLPHRLRQARYALDTAKQVLRQTDRKALPSEIHQAQAELLQAQSRERQARLDLQRSMQLFRSRTIPESDHDKALFAHEQARAATLAAKARLERLEEIPRPEDVGVARARVFEAEAALKTLQEQIQKQIIRAPYDGVILTRHVNLGQQVNPGVPLYILADPKSLEIFAETDENNLENLQKEQTALAIAPAFKDKPFPVSLQQISPQIDSKRGVVGLRLSLAKIPPFARIDLTVDVNVQTSRWSGSLSLPIRCLIMRENKPFVMTLENGLTRLLPIEIRGRNLDWIVVEKFSKNTPVLLDSQQLSEGVRLRLALQP